MTPQILEATRKRSDVPEAFMVKALALCNCRTVTTAATNKRKKKTVTKIAVPVAKCEVDVSWSQFCEEYP